MTLSVVIGKQKNVLFFSTVVYHIVLLFDEKSGQYGKVKYKSFDHLSLFLRWRSRMTVNHPPLLFFVPINIG